MPRGNLNLIWSRALFAELIRGGVREAVICPGSRSTPLALAAAEVLPLRTALDERSGAFLALGAAKALQAPAVVLCTSGSAGAHFYPALLEAEASGIPLIALTADRPPELHGFGAPQTLDQQRLFGGHVRFFADLGVPSLAGFPQLRALAARAAREPGPSHLNAPFREPLAPIEEELESTPDAHPAALLREERSGPDVCETGPMLRRRGAIVCGPRDAEDGLSAAVAELSRALGWPVIAEPGSQVRGGVAYADLILRSPVWARALQPEVILRIGGSTTSRLVQAWADTASQIVVHERGELIDPAHRAQLVLRGDAPALCRALTAARRADPTLASAGRAAPGPGAQLALWREAERRVAGALESAFSRGELSEPFAARAVLQAVPQGGQLFVSSSMPIRDLDAFGGPAGVRVLCNRGVNGIDGQVSTAAGAALATGRATFALVGDVALLHDLGGLIAAARLHADLTVVCVNNDGGGIFHFLPVAEHAEPTRFEELFGTPHGMDLQGAALLCGASFLRCTTAPALREALRHPAAGLRLIEVRTDRADNLKQHRALQAEALGALGEPP